MCRGSQKLVIACVRNPQPTQSKKYSWTPHWTPTTYLYTFHSRVSLQGSFITVLLWGHVMEPNYNSKLVVSLPPAFSLVFWGPFSSPRLESFILEAGTKTWIIRERGFWPKDFGCMFLGEFFCSPELSKPLARGEGKEEGGTIQTESWLSSNIISGAV